MGDRLSPVRRIAVVRPNSTRPALRGWRPMSGRRPGIALPNGATRVGGARTGLPTPPPPPPAQTRVQRTLTITPGVQHATPADHRGPGHTRRGPDLSGCLAPLLWLVLAAVGLFGLAALAGSLDDGSNQGSRSGATTQEAAGAPAGAMPNDALAPISLPGPIGNTARVRPLQVEVLVAPGVLADPESAAVLRDELPVFVDYVARHGIPGDGVAIGHGTPLRVTTQRVALGAAAASPTAITEPPSTAVARAVSDLAPFSEDDKAVIVLTTSDVSWNGTLPSAPAPDLTLTPAERPAALRGFVVNLRVGTGLAPRLPDGPHPSPQTITTDPTQRGALAEALARAWVDAYGGGWPT